MTGIKILNNRYFSHKRILLGVSLFFILMMAAVMIFHADPGSDVADYIMCKFCALMPMMFAVILPVILMIQDTVGNRFMRSVPCAGSLYMRGIPVMSVLIPLVWSIVTNGVYSAFILISGKDICNISDMLVLTAIFGGILALIACFSLSLRAGAISMAAFYAMSTFVALFFSERKNGGFGLPLWVCVLIFLGSFAAAFVVDMVISAVAYRKCNFKETVVPQSAG